MTDTIARRLAVLDVGEIVFDDAYETVVATFDPTPEAVAAWEARVAGFNTFCVEMDAGRTFLAAYVAA